MSKQNLLDKIKEIGSMDIKDIGKAFKKNKSNEANISYKVNFESKKSKFKEKSKLVLSIDLGSNSIKAVEGKYQKNILNIHKLIEVDTPEGAIIDGRIIDSDAILGVLQNLIVENNIKAKDVIFTTNSSSIINRDILIPPVAMDEMNTVVRYEIQQYLPINLDDYVIQFIFLDEVADDTGMKLKINVTAFPERIALSYYDVINSLDLNPYVLDVNYNSINKLANLGEFTLNDGQPVGNTVAFVDMGATSINVSILKDGKLDFTRMIKAGGDNIDYALSESMNMSIKSTEFLKIKEVDLLSTDEENIQTVTIKRVIDEILEELERIIQFYKNKTKSNIDELYIYGGVSNFKNIDAYLAERLNAKVLKIKEIKNINLGNDVLFNDGLSKYLNAIGAMIRI
jgi:type IV pilus assembly protein PilM